MGFLGLGGGTFVLAGHQLSWVPSALSHQVAAAILVVAVPLQATASVLAFLSRDPVASTAMGLLAATWSSTGVLTLLSPPGGRTPVLGLLLFYLATALAVPALIALTSKGLAAAVLGLAVARFAVTGVHEFTGSTAWMRVAGWVGVVLGVVALVAAASFALEDARRSPLPATMRTGPGRRALTEQELGTVGPVEREAGVRDQL